MVRIKPKIPIIKKGKNDRKVEFRSRGTTLNLKANPPANPIRAMQKIWAKAMGNGGKPYGVIRVV